MSTTATPAQIAYINQLREDKAYRLNFDPEAGSEFAPDAEVFVATQHAGVAAYHAPLDGISKDRASEIITALKAW